MDWAKAWFRAAVSFAMSCAALSVAEPGVSHGMITNGSVHSFRVIDGTLRLIAFDDPIEFESIGADTGALSAQNAVEARDRELT